MFIQHSQSVTITQTAFTTLPSRTSSHEQCLESSEPEKNVLALLMTVGFMGLPGPSGTLPTVYTEMLIERRNYFRDTAAHHFLDLFSHRTVSLFYEAWRKSRFYLGYEAGERENFTTNILDLVGVGLTSLRSHLQHAGSGIPDGFLAHFAGLLSQRPISANNLAALVRGYFKIDAQIEQFVGQWNYVPKMEQTCLGRNVCALGEDAFIGERIWDRQTKFRIKLGHLSDIQFADFLPGQPGAVALTELGKFCVGQSLACDIQLSLEKRCVPTPQFISEGDTSLRLGYNTWLHFHSAREDLNDACFKLLN